MQPDYSIYPQIDGKTAYGFLTRGCVNKCKWCIVPTKEGKIKPYMDIEQIAINGRNKIVLMDNNILGLPDYAEQQFKKIISMKLKVDFNQAMDARLVTDKFARLIAKTKWLRQPTFGCDTQAQIEPCIQAIRKIQEHGYKGSFMLYTMLHGDFKECLERVSMWRDEKWGHKIDPFAQPMLDLTKQTQNIPQWQNDMARWVNNKVLYRTTDFANYSPRNGFKCETHIRMQLS